MSRPTADCAGAPLAQTSGMLKERRGKPGRRHAAINRRIRRDRFMTAVFGALLAIDAVLAVQALTITEIVALSP